jgi:hypothetical protein
MALSVLVVLSVPSRARPCFVKCSCGGDAGCLLSRAADGSEPVDEFVEALRDPGKQAALERLNMLRSTIRRLRTRGARNLRASFAATYRGKCSDEPRARLVHDADLLVPAPRSTGCSSACSCRRSGRPPHAVHTLMYCSRIDTRACPATESPRIGVTVLRQQRTKAGRPDWTGEPLVRAMSSERLTT